MMNTRTLLRLWSVGALLFFILITAFLPPNALRAFDWIGYAVCHRIPERSFFIAGRQMPVCARDTGMFTGVLLGSIWLAISLRRRAAYYPSGRWFLIFAAFFAAWGFDGFNSYMLLLRGDIFIYEPQNWLRLTTGALMGITLSAFAAALFNQGLWKDAVDEPTVHSWREMLGLITCAALTIGLVLWHPDWLLNPLAATSAAGVVLMLMLVNAILILMMRNKHGQLQRLQEFAPYAALGIVLAVAELSAVAALRAWALPIAIGSAP